MVTQTKKVATQVSLLTMSAEPQLGEIRGGWQIGKPYHQRNVKYIWYACRECGKPRWVIIHHGRVAYQRCRKCNSTRKGENSLGWQGGLTKHQGYILIYLQPDDFYAPMTRGDQYVLEHRLVMAKHLGRCLQSWEIVHHKNGIRDDNRFSNLELTTSGSHSIRHNKGYRDGYRQGYRDGQKLQVQELKQEIRLLRWELKQREEVKQ